MTPTPLSRLYSMVSTSPRRTVTFWPKPSLTSVSAALAPEAAGVVEHVGCDLPQLLDAVGEGAGGHGCGTVEDWSGSVLAHPGAHRVGMIPA